MAVKKISVWCWEFCNFLYIICHTDTAIERKFCILTPRSKSHALPASCFPNPNLIRRCIIIICIQLWNVIISASSSGQRRLFSVIVMQCNVFALVAVILMCINLSFVSFWSLAPSLSKWWQTVASCGYGRPQEPTFVLCCLSEGKETGTRRRFHFYPLSSPIEFTISTHIPRAAGIVLSVWRFAMGWTVQTSNPGGVRFSVPPRPAPRPTKPPLQWVPGLSQG
jgi:hypothetical protein